MSPAGDLADAFGLFFSLAGDINEERWKKSRGGYGQSLDGYKFLSSSTDLGLENGNALTLKATPF
jgi:hypothetical protein